MAYDKIYSVLKLSRKLIKEYVKKGMTVVDCTMGNGNDTLLLAKEVGEKGKVIAFDIQQTAIDNTYSKLNKKGLINRVELILDGHENIDRYINKNIDLAIYNLGYLPKGDKSITTSINTTLESIEKTLKILKNNGLLLIVAYPGHKTGMDEKELLEEYLRKINQKDYNVLKNEFINQINNPPILYCLEKSNNN